MSFSDLTGPSKALSKPKLILPNDPLYDRILITFPIIRAGIIPILNSTWILWGVDRRSLDTTEFAGGRKKTETVWAAAQREGTEEACNVFRPWIDPQRRYPFIFDWNQAIFLVDFTFIDLPVMDLVELFQQRRNSLLAIRSIPRPRDRVALASRITWSPALLTSDKELSAYLEMLRLVPSQLADLISVMTYGNNDEFNFRGPTLRILPYVIAYLENEMV